MKNENLQDEEIKELVKRLEHIDNIKNPELKDKLIFEINELIELETGPGTKGDRYFKQILRRILKYGTLDKNPRPVWRDEYENASYYEKVVTEDGICKTIRVVRKEDGTEFELDPTWGVEVGKYVNRDGELTGKGLKVKPGKFSWMVDNVQIYDRHVSIAKELLQREPYETNPEVVFKTESTNAEDIKPNDITIKGYNDIREKIKAKNPDMKLPVAV